MITLYYYHPYSLVHMNNVAIKFLLTIRRGFRTSSLSLQY